MPAAPPSSGPTLSSGWYTGPTGLPVSGVDAAEGSGYLISSSGADGRQQWRGAGSGDRPLKPGPSDSGWVPGASQHGECRPGGRVCKSGWQMPLCSWNRITYGVRPQHPLAGLLAWDGSPASQPASQASQASQPAVFTAAVSSGSETCPRLYYSDSLAGHPGDPLQYP